MNRRGFFGRLAQIGAGAVAAKVVKPEAKFIGALPEPAPAQTVGYAGYYGTFTMSSTSGMSWPIGVASGERLEPGDLVYLDNGYIRPSMPKKRKRRTRQY